MLAVVGTLPDAGVPVLDGPVRFEKGRIFVEGREILPDRGTPALLGAACRACAHLGLSMPHAFLVGDEGVGKGSRDLYRHLVDVLPRRQYSTMVFHYLQPDADLHTKVLFAAKEMPGQVRLIADAGFMYAAKMSGQAEAYDLFTPDAGELAFLADADAPHPFYTRGFILHEDNSASYLIEQAYLHANAAACLMVKGSTDYVAVKDGILHEVTGPSEEALEAVGGTGDTLTGMAAVLVESGRQVPQAALVAARANRYAGRAARPTPGSRIGDLIMHIPDALDIALKEEGDA